MKRPAIMMTAAAATTVAMLSAQQPLLVHGLAAAAAATSSATTLARPPAVVVTTARPQQPRPHPQSQTDQQVEQGEADPLMAEYYRRRSPAFLDQAMMMNLDERDSGMMMKQETTTTLQDFHELRRSTGSEIVDTALQRQIDVVGQDGNGADAFLDAHVADASLLEKVAMASVTEQLPQPALQALMNNGRGDAKKKGKSKKKTKSKTATAESDCVADAPAAAASYRITPDEEIRLGRLVQAGVALHEIRAKAAEQLGTGTTAASLTKQEWAAAAGLKSTKQLRRIISDYRQAKQQLVEANMGLVHTVVNQQYYRQKRSTGVSREELVQEASLGLIRAAELFDPTRGIRFSTYAVVWIKGMLSNSHAQELVKLPARERSRWSKITQAYQDLARSDSGGSSDNISVEQVAAATGISVADVLATQQKMTQAKRVLSLDYEYASQTRGGGETTSMGAALQNNQQSVDNALLQDLDLVERTQCQADLVAAMAANLDAREARLVRLRYGLSDGRPRTMAECADAMGLSRTRIHQIQQRCLKKLREAAEAESLQEYLLTIA